jgi:Icc-related predicted phosphoesterase
MKILAVSDAHDISGFNNIVDMIDKVNPDLLLSCGDWGSLRKDVRHPTEIGNMVESQIVQQFVPILWKVPMFTLYGNHDELNVIEKITNEHKDKYQFTKCLLPDIEPMVFEGLKILGISGNYAWRKRFPWHKSFYELDSLATMLEMSDKLRNHLMGTHIFMSHECPDAIESIAKYGQPTLTKIIKLIKPKVAISGHVHRLTLEIHDEISYINLGMALHGDYATIDTDTWAVSVDRLQDSHDVRLVEHIDVL